MSSCCATRRASSTSATEQHPVSLSPPHSRIVMPTTSMTGVDAARPRRPTSRRRRSGRRGPSRCASLAQPTDGLDDRRRSHGDRHRPRSSCGRASAAARPGPLVGRRPSPPARATAPSRRWRTPTPRWRTPRPRRAGTAAPRSRCRRCTRAPSRRPCRPRSRSRATSSSSARRPSTSGSRSAAMRDVLGGSLGVGGAQRRGHGDDAGDVVRAAAPLALLAAADEHRRERRPASRTSARRRPSGRRTCAPTATSGRRAA